ncbi:LOW QUALITY PROTEIN: hypothetical protein HID58_076363, partial [Brassica napus]
VALSPDLQRGFSEVERLRVGFGFMERSVFPPLGSLQSSSSWSGGDGSRHSQGGGYLGSERFRWPLAVIKNGGEAEGGCNRGESVWLDALCACLWLCFDGSSMALRRLLDVPHLFQSLRFRCPAYLATASLEESSLLFFIVVSILWLMGTGPLVLKGQGCVDGFSGVIAFYEPASRHSSHPGTVVFYGGVADFLAGFGTAFQDVAVSLMAEASTYSFWDPVQASCGASFIPALLFARLWYVLELSPSDSFIDRESYELCGDHRELATPETLRELPASEETRRTSLSESHVDS